eukprot:gnl/TRDRNA2_/TRDRNA2_176354_c0_seq5.p1 gnl/TRDRNA2_/TRDRNA2_176354_c0~~gnl/TRDRNA2_/TRDRNA2_176354_c0_seq5.p1  ORF type:complete len:423 (-),score=23.71 gnl/TRDRNA2_/TRDRNA2_176354_c0_seq5:480-1748(-)
MTLLPLHVLFVVALTASGIRFDNRSFENGADRPDLEGRHAPMQRACIQRVPRESQWQNWQQRANMETADPHSVLNRLNDTGLLWLHFMDGWAVPRHSQWEKIFDLEWTLNHSSFVSVATVAFERMRNLEMTKELTANNLVWVNAPFLGPSQPKSAVCSCRSSGASAKIEQRCISYYNPYDKYRFNSSLLQWSRRAIVSELDGCAIWNLKPQHLEKLRMEIDPAVLDTTSLLYNNSVDRLELLQTYLDDYHFKIRAQHNESQVHRQHHADAQLDALAELLIRIAHLHPFCNGNGRMRTLILNRELVRLGYHPSLMFDYNREIYYMTRDQVKTMIVEGLFMWEDAVRYNCTPWTDEAVQAHRAELYNVSGLPTFCSGEFHVAMDMPSTQSCVVRAIIESRDKPSELSSIPHCIPTTSRIRRLIP